MRTKHEMGQLLRPHTARRDGQNGASEWPCQGAPHRRRNLGGLRARLRPVPQRQLAKGEATRRTIEPVRYEVLEGDEDSTVVSPSCYVAHTTAGSQGAAKTQLAEGKRRAHHKHRPVQTRKEVTHLDVNGNKGCLPTVR